VKGKRTRMGGKRDKGGKGVGDEKGETFQYTATVLPLVQ